MFESQAVANFNIMIKVRSGNKQLSFYHNLELDQLFILQQQNGNIVEVMFMSLHVVFIWNKVTGIRDLQLCIASRKTVKIMWDYDDPGPSRALDFVNILRTYLSLQFDLFFYELSLLLFNMFILGPNIRTQLLLTK